MRSVMANGLSLAAGDFAHHTIRMKILCTGGQEPPCGPGLGRQVVARVVTTVPGDLLLGLLVDEHLFARAQLGGAVVAPERLREAAELAAAALLLLRRNRVAELVRLGPRTRREAERVDLRDAGLADERERPLERRLVLGR